MNSAAIDARLRFRAADCIAPLLLLLAGMCFFVLRATDGFTTVPGDLGDARFNSIILEHLYQWTRGDTPSLWSPSFFYPATGTLAFSDNHFGSGPVYVLFRFMGLEREQAFNAWFAIGCALNFVATYFVMRRLQFASFPASVAAFIFAFHLAALAQADHAQLTYRFAIPLAYLAFLRFVQDRRIQHLAALAFWGAVQFFCSIYLGVFLVYLLAATSAAMLLPALRPPASPSIPNRSRGRAWAIAIILLSAGATFLLLFQYQSISRAYGFTRSAADIATMLPRPLSYLVADRVEAYRWLSRIPQEIPARQEHQLFMGFVPLLLGLFALATIKMAEGEARRRLLGQCAVTLLLLVAITMCIGDRSIYKLIVGFPGVSSIRAVSRIVLVMALPLAILAAIGVENLQRIRGLRWVVPALLVVALSKETLAYRPFSVPIAEWRSRVAPLVAAAEHSPLRADEVVYVTGREDEPYFLTELDGTVFAQDQKRPTLNGYSGNVPPGYAPPLTCNSASARIYSMAEWLSRSRLTPEELLTRTRWIPLQQCQRPYPAVDAAPSPPDQVQASGIRLDASVVTISQDELKATIHIHNGGKSMLHSFSRVGHPLRLSWRFVRMPTVGEQPSPNWEARQDIDMSLPPGGTEAFEVKLPPPSEPGTYELQFTLMAEGHARLQDLGMGVARTSVVVEPR